MAILMTLWRRKTPIKKPRASLLVRQLRRPRSLPRAWPGTSKRGATVAGPASSLSPGHSDEYGRDARPLRGTARKSTHTTKNIPTTNPHRRFPPENHTQLVNNSSITSTTPPSLQQLPHHFNNSANHPSFNNKTHHQTYRHQNNQDEPSP